MQTIWGPSHDSSPYLCRRPTATTVPFLVTDAPPQPRPLPPLQQQLLLFDLHRPAPRNAAATVASATRRSRSLPILTPTLTLAKRGKPQMLPTSTSPHGSSKTDRLSPTALMRPAFSSWLDGNALTVPSTAQPPLNWTDSSCSSLSGGWKELHLLLLPPMATSADHRHSQSILTRLQSFSTQMTLTQPAQAACFTLGSRTARLLRHLERLETTRRGSWSTTLLAKS